VKSMTAYGRAQETTKSGQWVVEIHSVNRRMLETSVFLPRDLLSLDMEVRKWIQTTVFRGQVTARIHFESYGLEMPLETLKSLKKKWETLAKELGYNPGQAVDLRFLLDQTESRPSSKDATILRSELEKVVKKALADFLKMREKEGLALQKDLEGRLREIEKAVKKIVAFAPEVTKKYAQRLRQKLVEAGASDEDRLQKELVIFADRADVSEEITRLKSHLKQFADLLKSKESSIGRTLDFLTQEMAREINTLSVKAEGDEMGKIALLVKSEVEKIREQVQNIE